MQIEKSQELILGSLAAPSKTNKELILGSLLVSSKTTRELAKEMNYITPDGTPRYKIIARDLRELKEIGFIDSRKEKLERKPGNIPTLYSIVINIQNMKLILAKYPRLISEMQKNDLVLESIFIKYWSLIDYLINVELRRCKNYRNSNLHSGGTEMTKSEKMIKNRIEDSNITFDPNYREFVENIFYTTVEKSTEELETKLQLSPEFFRFLLMTDKDELIKYID
jgi:DNA-binding HxlR family transcriptional regulator